MGITLAGAQLLGGDAYACQLDMYFRTIVYGLPRYVVQEEELSPVILNDTSHFRAAMATDPSSYLDESDFSDQFRSDRNSADFLRAKLGPVMEGGDGRVFIVVQIRQDLHSFSAIDGQCRQVNGELALINCGEPHVPAIDATQDSINAVLTAVKMELDITDGLDKHLDTPIYRTDDGKFVHWADVQMTATASVTHPIEAQELKAKANAAGVLIDKINRGIAVGAEAPVRSRQRRQNSVRRLAELIDALQLDPTTDDAYRRLWYLQLWHRAIKYGKALTPRLQLLSDHDLRAEKDHRNNIAHRGVERADGTFLRSFQQKLFDIIRSHV